MKKRKQEDTKVVFLVKNGRKLMLVGSSILYYLNVTSKEMNNQMCLTLCLGAKAIWGLT